MFQTDFWRNSNISHKYDRYIARLSLGFHAVTGSVELPFTSSRCNCIILIILINSFCFLCYKSLWIIISHDFLYFVALLSNFFNFRHAYQSLFYHPFTQDRHACLLLLFLFILLSICPIQQDLIICL